MIKKIYIKIIVLILLFLCFKVNIFAGKNDDNDGFEHKNVIRYSDFDRGKIVFEYEIKNGKNETVIKKFNYYKYMKVKDAFDKEVDLWLYNQTISTYDKEINDAKAKNLVDFYNNDIKEDTILNYGQYFMWMISSNGKGAITNNEYSNQKLYEEIVTKHNINDYSEISKPENYNLMFLIPPNTNAVGMTYETNYGGFYVDKSVPSKNEFSNFIKDINKKLGTNYSTSTNTENMSKFFTTSRMGEINTGYRVYSQTWLNKIGYKIQEALKQRNTAEGFSNQYSMFLTYKDGSNTYQGICRNVYNPDILMAGEITDLANWPRIDSLKSGLNWKIIWSKGLDKNPTKNSKNITQGLLNKNYENSSGTLFQRITPEMVRTYIAACQTWQGYYETWAKEVSKTSWYKSLKNDEKLYAKDIPLTVKGINDLGKKDYMSWYYYIQMCLAKSFEYVEYSNYASEITECVLAVSTGVGSYNTFVTSRIKIDNQSVSNLITNNVSIRNTKTTQSIQVVDLIKVFDVGYERQLELMKAKSVDEGKDRGEKLIIAAFLGQDVGSYLTASEIDKGSFIINDNSTISNLDVNKPYIVLSNLRYSTNFLDTEQAKEDNIAKLLNKDKTYNLTSNSLTNIMNKRGFAMYQEQYIMTETDPQVQFMMIVSDKEDTSTINSSSLKILGNTKYEKNIKDKKNKAKYFNEIYQQKSGTNTFLTSQIIKFKQNDINNGERVQGIVGTKTGNTNGNYFELVQSDFSTSYYNPISNILNRTIHSNIVNSKLKTYTQTGDLIKIGGKYNTAAKTLYGYWKMKTDDYNGTYDAANNLYYSTTFVIPEFASKVSSGKLYQSDSLGNKATSTSLKFYNEIGNISNLTVSNKANETKSVKFITRIASNDNGYFEEDYKEIIGYYIENYEAFRLLDDIFNKIKTTDIKQIKVISNVNKSNYSIKDKIAILELNSEDAKAFRNGAYTFLNTYIDNDNSAFNLHLNNVNRMDINLKSIIDGIKLSELASILLNIFIDDNNPYDNQDFIVFNINTPIDDIFISNSKNGYENVNYRKAIDWDGDISKYDIKTTLIKGDNNTILDTYNIITEENSTKINSKNYETSPITDSTKIYSTIYVGRNPEAQAAKDSTSDPELTLADFNVLMTENFNTNVLDYSVSINSNEIALETLNSKLANGMTPTQLKTALNGFKTSYTSDLLTKLYLNQIITDFNYYKIVPVEMKEMISCDIVNGKATNVIMSDWKSININDLKNAKIKSGTIIKYEIEYSLPYSINNKTTWEYMEKYINKFYRTGNWFENYDNIFSDLIDYQIVPKITLEDGKYYSSAKYNKVNTYTANDYTKEFFNSSSGRNLYFTKIDVVDKNGSIISSREIPYGNGITNEIINININNAKDDLYVRAYMTYKNEENKTLPSYNSNIKITAINSFYKDTLSSELSGSITGKMNHENINEYGKTRSEILTIPISQNILNAGLEQQLVLTIPKSIDNTKHNDWERVVIQVNGNTNTSIKDNEISDIILFKDTYNGKTYGDISRDNYKSGSQPLSSDLNENYYVLVKVKRNKGNMEENANGKGVLYVECLVNGKTRAIETLYQPNINGIFTNPDIIKGGVSLDDFDAEGEFMFFGFPLGTAQIGNNGISFLNIKAQYRVGNYLSNNLDIQDGNLNNNTWEESWGSGVDFYAEKLVSPEDMKYDAKKGSTEDIQIGISFTAGLNMDNSVYSSGSRAVVLNIYQYKESGINSGIRLTPKTVNGASSGSESYLGNGIYKIGFSSSFETNISAIFDKQKFTKGLYRYYGDINYTTKISNITEEDWTNNVVQGYMNVFEINDDIPKTSTDICPTPWTRNEWQVKFTWSNYEYAKPGGKDYMVGIYDKDGKKIGEYQACGHYCGNKAGIDNGKSNWGYDGNGGLYYEQHSLEIYLWTSGSQKLTNITNSTGIVKTGEIFEVIFKSIHKSNRDILPKSPSGRIPFAKTYATHVGPCDYLYRSPDISNVVGGRQVYITVSNASFALAKTFTPTSVENSSLVNKTYVFNPLGKIQVPLTNKNQTIYYTISSYPYQGHADTLKQNKSLCTSVSGKIEVQPSATVAGNEQDDNFPNENSYVD